MERCQFASPGRAGQGSAGSIAPHLFPGLVPSLHMDSVDRSPGKTNDGGGSGGNGASGANATHGKITIEAIN